MIWSGTERAGLAGVAALPVERRSAVTMWLLTVCGVAVTALCAHARVYVPWTPVPMTGQVFAVLLCGALLGGRYGALSQMIYLGLGFAGVPWLVAAPLKLLTVGYLCGFVFAAFFLGAMTRRFRWGRTLDGQIYLMLAAAGIIHLCGVAGLMLVTGKSLLWAVHAGSVPFIPVELLKVVAAALITSRVLRNSE